jgi:hypothetical protein
VRHTACCQTPRQRKAASSNRQGTCNGSYGHRRPTLSCACNGFGFRVRGFWSCTTGAAEISDFIPCLSWCRVSGLGSAQRDRATSDTATCIFLHVCSLHTEKMVVLFRFWLVHSLGTPHGCTLGIAICRMRLASLLGAQPALDTLVTWSRVLRAVLGLAVLSTVRRPDFAPLVPDCAGA